MSITLNRKTRVDTASGALMALKQQLKSVPHPTPKLLAACDQLESVIQNEQRDRLSKTIRNFRATKDRERLEQARLREALLRIIMKKPSLATEIGSDSLLKHFIESSEDLYFGLERCCGEACDCDCDCDWEPDVNSAPA